MSAFPSENTTLFVQVFYQKGDDPFICGVNGPITDLTFDQIHSELEEYEQTELFNRGDGNYLFRASYEPEQRGEYGAIEHAAYWQLDIANFRNVKEQT